MQLDFSVIERSLPFLWYGFKYTVQLTVTAALDAGGDRLPHRRPGSVLQREGDRAAYRLHHTDDP